jgi:hypothetical protein
MSHSSSLISSLTSFFFFLSARLPGVQLLSLLAVPTADNIGALVSPLFLLFGCFVILVVVPHPIGVSALRGGEGVTCPLGDGADPSCTPP